MNKKIYLIAITLLTFITSCDEWLYVEPTDGIIVDEYWQSKEDVKNAIFGCYASLLGNTGHGGYDIPTLILMHGELRADMSNHINFHSQYLYVENGDILPTNSLCIWDAFYKTINYCNLIIDYAPEVQKRDPTFTDEQRLEYEAEVTGIRAWMYFYLTRIYDEVPLKLTGQIDDGVDFLLPKSSRKEIFDQIKKDLDFAEEYIPETYKGKEGYRPAWDKGRFTKYTINAIQADVSLWCEQYDEALEACNKIINSGQFGLLNGYDDPEKWFDEVYNVGNSSESIFELQFDQNKLNPYYNTLASPYKQVIVNYEKIDDVYMNDPELPNDSIDIRSNGCSYLASKQYIYWKYMGKSRREERLEAESYAHFFVYRYAEILLFKAEALAYSENNEDLQQSLNIVNYLRKKRHASKLTEYTGNLSSKEDIGKYILEERNRELLTEGKRWFDVLRFGKKDDYKNKDLVIAALISSASSDRIESLAAKSNDTLFYYMPIPDGEISKNPNLEQNKFYQQF